MVGGVTDGNNLSVVIELWVIGKPTHLCMQHVICGSLPAPACLNFVMRKVAGILAQCSRGSRTKDTTSTMVPLRRGDRYVP